jgi:NTP pyrophosphatase (non-canonical NTP hydrolase)
MEKRPDTDSVAALTKAVSKFISERDWDPYHNPKNLSMGCAIEAAELMEHFQWGTGEESLSKVRDPEWREPIEEEVADVAIYILRIAEICGFDLGDAVLKKLVKNAVKYPVELVKGKPHKYTYYHRKGKK